MISPFIAFHSLYCHPLPEGHRFPMVKYDLLPQQLLREGIVESSHFFRPQFVKEKDILAVHEDNYWQKLKSLSLDKAEIRRMGFPLSEQLLNRELSIAQGSIDGAKIAMETGLAFNIAGGTHHAGSNWAEGFCLLNDQAIAAQYLLNHNYYDRILVIDLDVHQGNGTAEIFKNENRVFTFSIHGENNFPFKKEVSDWDIGLKDGIFGEEYLKTLEESLTIVFEKFQPQFVFYQSGVDVLASDKMGKLKLTIQDCEQRDFIVFSFCKKYKTPVQVSMGGGYSHEIKYIVDAHANTYKMGIDLIMDGKTL